jgi:hypothetical protein
VVIDSRSYARNSKHPEPFRLRRYRCEACGVRYTTKETRVKEQPKVQQPAAAVPPPKPGGKPEAWLLKVRKSIGL